MSVLSDCSIVQRSLFHGEMIAPFFDSPVRYEDKETGEPYYHHSDGPVPDTVRRVISYGVSSYGYDVRMKADKDHLRIFTPKHLSEINPKKIREDNFFTPDILIDEEGGKYTLIPPHCYLQGPTMEYFKIPRDILVIVLGKSTLARSAIICNVTPIEPEFEGEVVIEVANSTDSYVRCYLEEGIAQFVFLKGDIPCLSSYKDKAGKYQGQTGLTFAKV